MGRAAILQSSLEGRELLVADLLALVGTRHAERLAAVERAAEQRERSASTLHTLHTTLAQLADAVPGVQIHVQGGAPPPSQSKGSADAAAAARAATVATAGGSRDSEAALRRLADEMLGVTVALREMQRADASGADAQAAAERTLQTSLAHFTSRNNELLTDLGRARERIAELERAVEGAGAAAAAAGAAGGGSGGVQAAAPGEDERRRFDARKEAAAKQVASDAALRKCNSAEYKASAPTHAPLAGMPRSVHARATSGGRGR